MQKVVILVILIVVLVSGSVLALQFKRQLSVLSSQPQPSTTPTTHIDLSPTSQLIQSEHTTPTPALKAQPTIKPTSQPAETQGIDWQRYVYPGSTIISQTNENLILESSDDIMEIVAWYKQVLVHEDAQIKNTVVTTVNGKTNATFTVSTNGQNLYVTITHSDADTVIKLERK